MGTCQVCSRQWNEICPVFANYHNSQMASGELECTFVPVKVQFSTIDHGSIWLTGIGFRWLMTMIFSTFFFGHSKFCPSFPEIWHVERVVIMVFQDPTFVPRKIILWTLIASFPWWTTLQCSPKYAQDTIKKIVPLNCWLQTPFYVFSDRPFDGIENSSCHTGMVQKT